MKLHIIFPLLISGMLIKQKYDILIIDDVADVSPSSLNFSYKLFGV